MQMSKLWKARLLLIILGLSSLYMADRDSTDGEATRVGMNLKESENPTLFKIEILKKYGGGIFLICVGLFMREKKKPDKEE
jgi:hypothetical protein